MRRLLLLTIVGVGIAGCGAPAASPTPSPTPNTRPATPVQITLISPTNGEVVHGTQVLVKVAISGGTITTTTTTQISPTKGHVHLYLNNELIYMSYTLQQEITVQPGLEYAMYAEFVAQDHFPFSPRDQTPKVFFTVAPS